MLKRNKGISLFLAILFFAGVSTPALALQASDIKQVVPIGHTTGIKLYSSGVVVAGVTPIETGQGQKSPAADAGIVPGDVITKINDTPVQSNEKFRECLLKNGEKPLVLTVLHEQKERSVTVSPVRDTQGDCKLGLWIRDSMAGIGTITFYDPEHHIFGALGHGVCDTDSNLLIPFGHGSVMESRVTDVKKGAAGAPGELVGDYNLREDYGTLSANTESGIFGQTEAALPQFEKSAVPIAARNEIKTGPAVILSNIEGDHVEEYQIEITKIYPEESGETKNMLIRVTDERLIAKTGGIVQGMSGSPILQNGKLVGAVTHVLVNDPQKGYGIFIDHMISTAFDKIYKSVA